MRSACAFLGELVRQPVLIGLVWAERGRNVESSLSVTGNIQSGFSLGISNSHKAAAAVHAVNLLVRAEILHSVSSRHRNLQVFIPSVQPVISQHTPLFWLKMQVTDISCEIMEPDDIRLRNTLYDQKRLKFGHEICINLLLCMPPSQMVCT